jgi:hypothetical protein
VYPCSEAAVALQDQGNVSDDEVPEQNKYDEGVAKQQRDVVNPAGANGEAGLGLERLATGYTGVAIEG